MDKATAHNLFENLMKERKQHYSASEMIVILTSQYYNILDIHKLIPELDPNEYNISNMTKELLSICESFQNNLKSVNENFSWDDKDQQILMVSQIKKSCQDSL